MISLTGGFCAFSNTNIRKVELLGSALAATCQSLTLKISRTLVSKHKYIILLPKAIFHRTSPGEGLDRRLSKHKINQKLCCISSSTISKSLMSVKLTEHCGISTPYAAYKDSKRTDGYRKMQGTFSFCWILVIRESKAFFNHMGACPTSYSHILAVKRSKPDTFEEGIRGPFAKLKA